jgi:UDP-3-O-[3-hydroxymyristoyl] glucosamine N-acyltransferase
MTSQISGDARIERDVQIGHFCVIGDCVIEGMVTIGHHCVIEDGVHIGAGTVIKNGVEIRNGVHIGENCYIDSGAIFTGNAVIGNDVTIRNNVVVARGCDIGDGAFICPQVMFNNLDHYGNAIGGARIGRGCFIGTQTVLAAGISIDMDVVVGSCSMVTKDIEEDMGGVYIGVPARKVR